ncbi:hypothetical protein F5146DRAFT_997866 [Armillaria mellea]|nr:hypothetical protein F5146DRAFT_997866 [Armillaria mellea]
MLGDSNIGTWIQFAKLTAAAGEMAPFPYIKGVAGCIATILEVIEQAGKNNEDLQDLAESIGTTIRIIKETVEAHSDTSVTHFHDVKSKRIMQFLTMKKVSGIINGYKQYYKGQVGELFLGDIYIGDLVSPSGHDSALGYHDRYGTVECSSTAKIIHVYQHSPDNEGAILEAPKHHTNLWYLQIAKISGNHISW